MQLGLQVKPAQVLRMSQANSMGALYLKLLLVFYETLPFPFQRGAWFLSADNLGRGHAIKVASPRFLRAGPRLGCPDW